MQNMATIAKHNADPTKTYQLGVNQFSDLTDTEFAALHLTLRIPKEEIKVTSDDISVASLGNDELDWLAKGKVSAIKDQGTSCVAGWAFASTSAL